MRSTTMFLAAAAVFATPLAAHAWTVGPQGPGTNSAAASDSGSAASAAARSSSRSASRSNASNRTTVVNNIAASGGSSGGAAASAGGHHGGGLPVSTAVAPAFLSYNSCAGSAAGVGIQGGSFGLSIGTGGGFDNACRLHQLGQDDAAIAYLCRANNDVRKAFEDVGRPCPEGQTKPAPVAYHPQSLPYADSDAVVFDPKQLCESYSRGDRRPAICRR